MNLEQKLDALRKAVTADALDQARRALLSELSADDAARLLILSCSAEKTLKIKILRVLIESSLSIQPQLVEAFGKEKDPDAKLLLTVALGRLGNKKIITSFIELIRGENQNMRQKAVLALQLIGIPALKELLIIMFKSLETDQGFSEVIADIVAQIPGKSLNDLEKIATFHHPLVAKILGSIDDPKVVEILVTFLEDRNHILSKAVREALCNLGPKYCEAVAGFLAKDNREYQYWLTQVLIRYGEVGRKALFTLSKKASPELFSQIMSVMEYRQDAETRELYTTGLIKGNLSQKEIAARKIVIANDMSLVFELKKIFLTQTDSNNRYFILLVLHQCGAGDDIIDEYLRGSPADRLLAAIIKTTLPKKEDFTFLIELLKDDDPFIRQASLNVLGRIARECFDQLMEASMSVFPEIKRNCLKLIRGLGKETVVLISEKLKNGNSTEKFQACHISGELYLYDVKELLEKLVNDGNDWVRQYSRVALAKLGGPDELSRMLKTGNSDSLDTALLLVRDDPSMYTPPFFKVWGQIPGPYREKLKKNLLEQEKRSPGLLNQLSAGSGGEQQQFFESLKKQINLHNSFS